jgi:hypothetical protein
MIFASNNFNIASIPTELIWLKDVLITIFYTINAYLQNSSINNGTTIVPSFSHAFVYAPNKTPCIFIILLNNKLSNLALKCTERITQEDLKDFVTYSKESGLFRWKKTYLGSEYEGTSCRFFRRLL